MRTPSTAYPRTPAAEDKRLERLYDYTKFHIGIYLSFAGGVATLLASKDSGWVVSSLIGNQYLLYAAFALLVLAGMCGGMVATSITESKTYEEFWSRTHYPPTISRWRGTGQDWVNREHGFFWASLLVLAASILIRWPGPPDVPITEKDFAPKCSCLCEHAPALSRADSIYISVREGGRRT